MPSLLEMFNKSLDEPLPMDGRLSLLPARITKEGKEFALPGLLASAWNAFTAPARSYKGEMEDPMGEALNVAGMAMTGAMPFSAPKGSLGMNVWHGSPHKFDKFDAKKIGTGEGAQAYGHGLYFAENPKVASEYRKVLSATQDFALSREAGNARIAKNEAARWQAMLDDNSAPRPISARSGKPVDDAYIARQLKAELEELSRASKRLSEWQPGGSIYKVDLPDDQIAKMLDWDKPLSQQAKSVQDALKKVEGAQYAAEYFKANRKTEPTGADLHEFLRLSGYNPNQIAPAIRDAGIPGIRYLDGGSRGVGGGTSNFVVFPGNENLLTILERNGVPLKP